MFLVRMNAMKHMMAWVITSPAMCGCAPPKLDGVAMFVRASVLCRAWASVRATGELMLLPTGCVCECKFVC
jgi:hypothetical protein